MRFREKPFGQRILRLPGGERLLDLAGSTLEAYQQWKYHKYPDLAVIPWAIRQSRDGLTLRALTDRLRDDERKMRYVPIHLRCVNGSLLARPLSTDRRVIREIFRRGEYRPIHGWTFNTVLDCGANCGIFAAYAHFQAGSGLRAYIGVEPDPDSFAILSEQIKVRKMESIATLFQAAVSAQDGTSMFDNAGASWSHRLSDGGNVLVQTLSVNSLLDRAGLEEVDLLKLDIEGGEKQVLENWEGWRHRVKCVVLELHSDWDPLDFDWFASVARAAGYQPMQGGTLFHGLPGAVRGDLTGTIGR